METDGNLPLQMDSLAGKETQKIITVPGMTDCNEGRKRKETSVGRRSGIQGALEEG